MLCTVKHNESSYIPTCPVTFQPIDDPVIVDCPCNGSVGREAFVQWVQVYPPEQGGMPMCPCCGECLQSLDTRPNYELASEIFQLSQQLKHQQRLQQQPSLDEEALEEDDCAVAMHEITYKTTIHHQEYHPPVDLVRQSNKRKRFQSEKKLTGMGDYVTCCTALDDNRVACGSANGVVRIFRVDTGVCEASLVGHSNWVECCVVLPDGKRLVTGSHDKTLRVWNLRTGKCTHVLTGHQKGVSCCEVHGPCRIVSGSHDQTLKIWNVDIGVCEKTIKTPSRVLCCAVLCLPGVNDNERRTVIVSGGQDRILRVWDNATGSCRMQLAGHQGSIKCCCAILDFKNGQYHRWVVTGSEDATLKVWNIETGVCEATLEGHKDWILSVAVLSEISHHEHQQQQQQQQTCHKIVSSSGDQTLKVWDLRHAEHKNTNFCLSDGVDENDSKIASSCCQQTLSGHSWIIPSCASLGPDRFVSASYDRTVRVWGSC